MNHQFLPVSKEDLKQRGIDRLDFVYITGDAYVDHPSFGWNPAAIRLGSWHSRTGRTGRVSLRLEDRGLVFLYPQEIWIRW